MEITLKMKQIEKLMQSYHRIAMSIIEGIIEIDKEVRNIL